MKKTFDPKTWIGPCPVFCIGTYAPDGRPNVMTASWSGICCGNPASVAVSLRQATYTYSCLMETKAFTISAPPQKYAREADYFGIASGRIIDKFQASGLTPTKADTIYAPFVDEFPMVLECEVTHTHDLGLHTQFIGKIVNIKADESILGENGRPDMTRIDPFVFDPANRTYHGLSGFIGEAFNIGKAILKG